MMASVSGVKSQEGVRMPTGLRPSGLGRTRRTIAWPVFVPPRAREVRETLMDHPWIRLRVSSGTAESASTAPGCSCPATAGMKNVTGSSCPEHCRESSAATRGPVLPRKRLRRGLPESRKPVSASMSKERATATRQPFGHFVGVRSRPARTFSRSVRSREIPLPDRRAALGGERSGQEYSAQHGLHAHHDRETPESPACLLNRVRLYPKEGARFERWENEIQIRCWWRVWGWRFFQRSRRSPTWCTPKTVQACSATRTRPFSRGPAITYTIPTGRRRSRSIRANRAPRRDRAERRPTPSCCSMGGTCRCGRPSKWIVRDGYVEATQGSLTTKQEFGSYQLHLEWQGSGYPRRGTDEPREQRRHADGRLRDPDLRVVPDQDLSRRPGRRHLFVRRRQW